MLYPFSRFLYGMYKVYIQEAYFEQFSELFSLIRTKFGEVFIRINTTGKYIGYSF